MTRTVLNGRGQPVTLTPDNCTIDGYRWSEKGPGYGWDDMNWSAADFYDDSILGQLDGFFDPHLHVPHLDGETAHRIRGKRWKITRLLP